jgi:uncharacterized protein (TIGR02147 family)
MSIHIGQFPDYRDFLKEKFLFEKSKKYAFSLQFCADKLNVSKTFVKLVLDKKRHFSIDTIPSLWELFKLDPKERLYFTFLFCKTISHNELLKGHFDLILQKIQDDAIAIPQIPATSV